jgi:predicted DNA-binding protein (MmcQ/YjbR family)
MMHDNDPYRRLPVRRTALCLPEAGGSAAAARGSVRADRSPAPREEHERVKHSREDLRLRRLTHICLALPETARRLTSDHADFRVRGRVFAYFLQNHHGDGIVSVCCRSQLGENVDRVSRDPERFYLPAYIGARGWFGLRLDRGTIDWREVQNVVECSYRLAAPKSLVMAFEERPRASRQTRKPRSQPA